MKKQKQKTNKATAKRFKVTPTGKVMHRGHGARHLKSKKNKKRLRDLKQKKELSKTHKNKILKMMGLK